MDVKRLLYVEDNPGDVLLLREALQSLSGPTTIELTTLDHGTKALAFLQEKASARERAADLILLDANLPGVSGIDLWKYIAGDPSLSQTRTLIYQMPNIALPGIPAQAQVEKPRTWDGFVTLAESMLRLLG